MAINETKIDGTNVALAIRDKISPEIDLMESDNFVDPPEQFESLLDKVIRTGAYGGLGYGGLVASKAGFKHLTPFTKMIAEPLKKASTRIEGYYDAKKLKEAGKFGPIDLGKSGGKINLLYDHWKKSDLPAVTEYLEKYGNKRDPFGVPWRGGVTESNINRLRTMMNKYGTMVGLDGGIETADELKFATRIRNARNSYFEADKMGDLDLKNKAERLIKRNENLLRYEMQKTELIKHSFGEKINQARWRSSGLGKLKTTTLESALDGNTRAIRQWKKGGRFLNIFGGIDEATKVTASQYTGKDHATLIRNAKHFGSSYIKIPYAEQMGAVLGREGPVKYMRVNGMREVAEQAYRYYEQGATRNGINRWLDILEKGATNDKTKDMLTQFRNYHDFVNGKLKVNYSFVSTQQTVAGVNSDMVIWRGKGTSPGGRAKVAIRGGMGTPGKLYHKILVSDLYDVAGSMGATSQKNLHMNVAKSTNAGPNALKFAEYGDTRKRIYKSLVNKETNKLAKLLPKASKKALLRLARYLVFRR